MNKLTTLFALLIILVSTRVMAWTGSGTSGDPYQITTAAELATLATNVNNGNTYSGTCFKLMNDLSLSAYSDWDPIGNYFEVYFKGVFDGNNKKITGLSITNTNSDVRGLFGTISSGCEIKDLSIEGCNVTGYDFIGALVGLVNVGEADKAIKITNCKSSGTVSGSYYVGGLIGGVQNYYVVCDIFVTNCSSLATVSCSEGNTYAGGLIGYINAYSENNKPIVSNSFATGSVTANGNRINSGGLIGQIYGSKIVDCYATGSVTSTGSDTYAGGFSGYVTGSSVTNCYSTGAITGADTYVRGFLGFYDLGMEEAIGLTGAITSCYWDKETSGKTTSGGGAEVGKTTAEMKTQGIYTSWDYATLPIWKINGANNNGYPFLAWQTFPAAPEIDVKQGTSPIADGTGNYDFGSQNIATITDIVFTVENIGNAASTLGSFIITGTDASQFSFQGSNPTTVANVSSVTFTVRFTPASSGAKTAMISFANQDSNENPYNFAITGTGILPTYNISGSAGVVGALITYTGGTTTADGSGNYSFTVNYGWSGTSSASKTGYTFSADKSYSNVTGNQTAQNFTYSGNFTWTGNSTNDWNTAANWNSTKVPTSADNAIIPGVGITNFPMVNELSASPAVCNNLTIHLGGKLTVAGGKALTVSGNLTSFADSTGLVIKSDVNGTGSLKVLGSVSAPASVQRFTNLNRWYLVSSPIGTQTVKDFIAKNTDIPILSNDANTYGMRGYSTGDLSEWSSYFTNSYLTANSSQAIGVGMGYLVRTYSEGLPNTLNFQGNLNSQGNLDVTLARIGTNGWNLIGNPYTAAIKIYDGTAAIEDTPDNFINANDAKFDDVSFGVYFWNDASTPKKFDVINKSSDNIDNPGVTYAQVGQGFFVRAKAVGSSAMSFTTAMQFHKGGEALKSGAAPCPKIDLIASSGDQKSASTDIKFIEGATKGLDRGYDAGILKADPTFAIYTKLVEPFEAEFQLQCLPPSGYDKLVIPIGIDSKAGGEIIFTAQTVQLDPTCKVILEDKLTNTFTDLSKNSYKVALAANTLGTGRFYIHTGDIVSGLEDQVLPENITAYANGNKEIRVIGKVGNEAVATLYNGLGQVVLSTKLGAGTLNIIGLPNLSSGVYLLNINDNGTTQTIKVMVRK